MKQGAKKTTESPVFILRACAGHRGPNLPCHGQPLSPTKRREGQRQCHCHRGFGSGRTFPSQGAPCRRPFSKSFSWVGVYIWEPLGVEKKSETASGGRFWNASGSFLANFGCARETNTLQIPVVLRKAVA